MENLCRFAVIASLSLLLLACQGQENGGSIVINWYVFNEPSSAFRATAERCGQAGHYRLLLKPLPADADQQREQLARRLAAR